MRRILIALFFLAVVWEGGIAQNCFCDNCPVSIADADTTFFTIDIVGAANNDLSDPAQGVCEFCLNFEHEYLGDLLIQLVSPAGQVVTLVGPVDLASGFTSFTDWDVCFVPCADVPSPDPGFSATWDNDQPWGFFGNYAGSYFPFQGCLEDFNTGPVDGTWTLMVIDDISFSTGEILDYSITFCDDTNLECVSCDANAGQLNAGPFANCAGDSSWLLSLPPSFPGPAAPADSSLYDYVYLLSRNDTLIQILDEPNLINFPPGSYEICGMSYLMEDSLNLPPVDGSVLVSELRDILVLVSPPFCGRITQNCVQVDLLSEPLQLQLVDTICFGDTLFVGGDTLTSSGQFDVLISPVEACDTIYQVNLTILPEKDSSLFQSICAGDFFVFGTDTLSSPGTYTSVFTASTACDSIVTLELEVLMPEAVIQLPDTLSCLLGSVQLDGSASSAGANYSYVWSSLAGDSISFPDSIIAQTGFPGVYQLLVQATGQFGGTVCTDTAEVEVEQDTITPFASILGDSVLNCTQAILTLSADTSLHTAGVEYEWTGPSGFIDNSIQLAVSAPGAYILRVTDLSNGCESLDTQWVTLDTLSPPLALFGDTLSCADTLVWLYGQSDSTAMQFSWLGPGSFSSSADSILVGTAGWYVLEVSGQNGCLSKDSIFLTEDFIPPAFSIQGDSFLTCVDTVVQLMAVSSDGDLLYSWTLPSGSVQNGDSLEVTTAGIYVLEAIAANGCTAMDSFELVWDTLSPSAQVFGDTLSCVSPVGQLAVEPQLANWIYFWSGPGSFSDTTTTPEVTLPGSYQLTITADNGCTASYSTQVEVDTLLPEAIISGVDTLNCAVDSLRLISTGNISGTYVFLWQNALGDSLSNQGFLDVSLPGWYSLSVVNTQNGCQQTDSVFIPIDTLSPVADAGPDQFLTCTNPSVTLDGSASTGNALSYLWLDPQGNVLDSIPVTQASVAGDYQLWVTNQQNNCTEVDTIFLTPDADLPFAIIQNPGQLTCLDTLVALDGSASSSGPNFQYTWLGPDSSLIDTIPLIFVDAAGTYTLLVENVQNGCIAFDEITVLSNFQAPFVQITSAATELNCALETIWLEADYSTAGALSSLSWQDEQGLFLGLEDSLLIQTPGLYYAEVINLQNGCIASDSVVISQNILPPTAIILGVDTLDCIQEEVVLSGMASQSTGTLGFAWQNSAVNTPGTDSLFAVTLPGVISLIVVDSANFCSDTAQVEIFQDTQAVQLTIQEPLDLNCLNDSVMLLGQAVGGGPEYLYEWQSLSGQVLGTDSSLVVDTAAQYLLIAQSVRNACLDSSLVFVLENRDTPFVDAGPDTVLSCLNASVFLSGTSIALSDSLGFQWTDQGGALLGQDSILEVTSPGTFFLEVVDLSNGCRASDSLTVFPDLDAPMAVGNISGTITCMSDTVLLDASGSSAVSGSFGVEWFQEGNLLSTALSLSVVEAGEYTLIITDSLNGCTASDLLTVFTDTLPPSAAVGPEQQLNCAVDSLLLTAASSSGDNLDFQWLDENGIVLSQDTSLWVQSPGLYILDLLQQTNGCRDSDTVLVTQNVALPVSQPQASGLLTCQDTSVLLSAGSIEAGWIYAWENTQGEVLAQNMNASVNEAGDYFLLVTDTTNFCRDTSGIEVQQNIVAPVALALVPDSLDCETTSLSVDGSSSLPTNGITYNWLDDNGNLIGVDPSLELEEGGAYVLEVIRTDNGCTDRDSFMLEQDTTLPFLQLAAPDTLFCNTDEVLLDASGSDFGPGFSTWWVALPEGDTLGQSLLQAVLSPGDYLFISENVQTACINQDTVRVLEDLSGVPQFSVTSGGPITCAQPLVPLVFLPFPDQDSISVEWQLLGVGTLGFGDTLWTNQSGSYLAIGENSASGCRDSLPIFLGQNIQPPTAVVDNPDTLSCTLTSVLLNASSSQPAGQLSFSWFSGSGALLGMDMEVSVDSAGIYQLVVIDTINGCSDSLFVNVISIGTPPIAEAGEGDTLNCKTLTVTLDAAGSATGQHLYFWSDDNGPIGEGSSLSVEQGGWYFLTVLDTISGCEAIDSLWIEQDTLSPQALLTSSPPFELNCQTSALNLDAASSLPQGQLLFEWQDAGGAFLTDLPVYSAEEAGLFYLIVENDQNGCRDTLEAEVSLDDTLPTALILPPDTIDCTNEIIFLNASSSQPEGDLLFLWQGPGILSGQDSSIAGVNISGLYQLTLVDTTNFCERTDSVWVFQDTLPPLAVIQMPGNIDCMDSTVVLMGDGSSTGPDFIYLWTSQNGTLLSGENTLEPLVTAGADYMLMVTDLGNGCTATASVSVDAVSEPPEATLELNRPSCPGFRDGSIRLDSIWNGLPPYVVSINGGAFVPGLQAFPNLTAGSYEIVVQDAQGCEWSQEVLLEDPEGVSLDLGTEIEIELGQEVVVQAQLSIPLSSLASIDWQYPADKVCRDSLFPECLFVLDTPLVNTTYKVTVEDENGCRATEQVLVRVRKDRPVFVPNSFSPNGDGRNERFTLFAGPDIVLVNRLAIFDRWGELLFENENFLPGELEAGWDGTYRNKKMTPGVYVYHIELTRIDGEILILKGGLSLIR
jgi:gliding motility-associated-like protein